MTLSGGSEGARVRRLAPIRLDPEDQMMMDETLICLQERRGSKLVWAFFDIAKQGGPGQT